MPNLLAMSFEGVLTPSFRLAPTPERARGTDDGWGVAFYPGSEPSAFVFKEHTAGPEPLERELVEGWSRLASSIFVLHIRRAAWGPVTLANTQPFARSWRGRDWLFAHAGSLRTALGAKDLTPGPFEPVGLTDTEAVFCLLMNRIAAAGWGAIGDMDLDVFHGWLLELETYGQLSFVMADGLDLLAYSDAVGESSLRIWKRAPPYNHLAFGDDELSVDLFRRGIQSRNGVVICSDPLVQDGQPAAMRLFERGELLVLRQGTVVQRRLAQRPPEPAPISRARQPPRPAPIRRLSIRHTTVYSYDKPVERSTHVFRLTPTIDRLQSLVSHAVRVSVPGRRRDYDDVFGNRVAAIWLDDTWREMRVEAESVVDVLDTDPLRYRPLRGGRQIPLPWMPWQQQVLQPFLLPPELPESQLHALSGYAMSFVHRNGFDILETMLDINATLYDEYTYSPGSTNLHTSAWEVYTDRTGVCQDFTNLFICLARLLGVPARYVCGYVFTGPRNPNQLQSEASHAWVQLYLPELGWTGFDPTNGCVTQTEHVRVAVGRNYMDATPTRGTIYVGGGRETLEVDVRVTLLEERIGTR